MKKWETNLNLTPNVIDGEELEDLFNTVFSQMAYYVSRTYGPFGENTGYQVQDRILTTKDGWTVEQGVIYSKNMLANIIRKFIIEVSRSINVHAGDGTTTGVIAANEINKLIVKYKKANKIHSKFLSAALVYCVEEICKALKKKATKITDENMDDIIYRIAEVSLDWDREFAGYIRDIYHETHNPVIRVKNSGYESSFVEYTNGYDIAGKLISEFKVNSLGTKSFTTENPVILVFSYTITADMFESLLTVATYFKTKQNRELIIMAPDFEKDFRDNYNAICVRMVKNKMPLISMTMARYFTEYTIDKEMLNDFCFLTGANIVSREYNEAAELIANFVEVGRAIPPIRENYPNGKQGDKLFQKDMEAFNITLLDATTEFENKIEDYVGTCDSITISDKEIMVSGFGGLEDSEALTHRKETIMAEVTKATKEMTAKSMFTEEIKLKNLRLGKLRLKMGTINVGGFGENNLKAKRDALDDAINACSNAYLEGVVVGGGVAIPFTIKSLLDKLKAGSWDPSKEKFIDNKLVEDILVIIRDGFVNTWKIMLENRYNDGMVDVGGKMITTDDLIKQCIHHGVPWDLIAEDFNEDIIHPVKVETEVVKGCLHLVLTTTTTNQLLYNGFEGIDDELRGMREVIEE